MLNSLTLRTNHRAFDTNGCLVEVEQKSIPKRLVYLTTVDLAQEGKSGRQPLRQKNTTRAPRATADQERTVKVPNQMCGSAFEQRRNGS